MSDSIEQQRLAKLYEQLRLNLLDLSRKNPMLNYSFGARSKRHLQIVDEVLDEVYRKFVGEDASLKVIPLPEPDDTPPEEKTEDFVAALDHAKVADIEYLGKLDALEKEGRDDEIELAALDRELRIRVRSLLGLPPRRQRVDVNRADHARSLGIDPSLELPKQRSKPSHDDQSLQTLKYPDELEAVMEKIADRARLAEQEMGISTLFLAFGFLEWYDSDDSDKKAFAPLLLLPAKLESRKVHGKDVYYLSAREGEAEANLSLQKLLDQKQKRALPSFETREDGAIGSIEEFFDQTRAAVDGLKRWQIRRWLVLGHFAFGRFAMYADLGFENWKQHPVTYSLVKAILSGSEREEGGALLPSIPSDYQIDDPEIEKAAPVLIHDADASQHSALIDVMRGKNLVIQGPPGTGKSQTIANIIANVLTAGKRVLFLAEKRAALDVVKRRLDGAGIGDFCLELHSDKASPKLVVESLRNRANLGWGKNARTSTQTSDAAWHQNRKEIADYLNALHADSSDGTTPFTLIWKALRGRTQYADVIEAFKNIALPQTLLTSPAKIADVRSRLVVFANTATTFTQAFQHPAVSPWASAPPADIPRYEIRRLVATLTELRASASGLVGFTEQYGESLGVTHVGDIEQLAVVDEAIGEPPDTRFLEPIAQLDLDELKEDLSRKRALISVDAALYEKPDLSAEPLGRLNAAIALVHSGAVPSLLDKAPAELYATASRSIAELSALVETLESFLPTFPLLGIDTTLPANTLHAITIATIIASKIAPDSYAWAVTVADIDEGHFAAAYSAWSTIRVQEQEWRRKLELSGTHPRPYLSEIDAAAATLRKAGIKRAFALITGGTRAARDLALRLGLSRNSPNLAEELEKLANHVRSLIEFESNREMSELFGELWQGLNTPFDEIAAGIKLRNFVRGELRMLASGDLIATAMIEMGPSKFAELGRFSVIGQKLRNLAEPLKHWLVDRLTSALIPAIRAEIADMQKALDADRGRVLSGLALPVKEIAEVAALMAQKERLEKMLSRSRFATAIDALGSSIGQIEQSIAAIGWIRSVRRVAPSGRLAQALTSTTASSARAILREAAAKSAALAAPFRTLLRTATQDFGMTAIQDLEPPILVTRLDLLLAHQSELPNFMAIRRQRQELSSEGLLDMLNCADRAMLAPDRLTNLFDTLIAEGRADFARRTDTTLSRQDGATLEARRRAFVERDRIKITNDRLLVNARLLQNTPEAGSDVGPRKTWTEMSLLKNEFPKQKRFTPVRALLSRAGRSVQVLKPCFMMSPLSLAKFVSPGSLEFDILLIDEASQMRSEDALGGMLRAKQIVVVGDSKQLPPTDFFARSEDVASSEDEFEDIDDESILDGCEKIFRDVRRLKWHYRSRCESLIAFSNAEFYRDSPLITFPMARPGSFSIDLVRVDGSYQARRNVAEAVRVAEEAIQFMRHHADLDAETIPTLGVATVNIDQRDLIQEELRRLAADDMLVEQYREKVEKRGEPLFIKNLENVQGDERDFIFISMTYGREPGATAMKQRFGPINGKQGHRRLNVLFSRARIRIGLFTSFGSADVTPGQTSAAGVHVLKRYLEYAERRGRAAVEGIGAEPDSDFEVEVWNRLRSRGYEVDFQVGVSGYKIDLGVRHPDHLETFLAGVECDGARYHSSKSARDRDRLREEVLRGHGWEILRVWSTDWFDDPDLESGKLAKKLEQLRSQPRRAFNEYRMSAKDDGPVADRVNEAIPQVWIEEAAPQGGAVEGVPGVLPADEGVALPNTPMPDRVGEDGTSQLAHDGPLNEAQAFRVLEEFRETVIKREMTEWEPHRSILRDGMIETFVRQRVTDSEEWFRKVPQFQRSGTNPIEKSLFLNRICDIVQRIDDRDPEGPKRPSDSFALTSPVVRKASEQPHLPLGPPTSHNRAVNSSAATVDYIVADMATIGIVARADRFYDPDYATTMKRMVAHVIEVEGPIYDDLLVTRIARAHGFLRSGSSIQKLVFSAVERRFPRTKEEGRDVFWKIDSQADIPISYRSSASDVRSHSDVPIAELASLALPFLRLRMDDEQVLRKMAEHFLLGRLREATRDRFQRAISFARSTLSPRS